MQEQPPCTRQVPFGQPKAVVFSAGLYSGMYREWYSSGRLYKEIHYTNGADDYGQGWRENGKLFMNYVMRNGRRYGIVNSNLCYTVKNEQGEFTESTANNDSIPR